jgi:peroxiredoxin (alkyl hydroperoxide reductase subunit C)
MIGVGDKLPEFSLTAVANNRPGEEFTTVHNQSFPGKWLVLFTWPMDFTFVCPTEIAEFGRRARDFRECGAEVLGASIDTEFVHLAWRGSEPMLKDLPILMLADTKRELVNALGVMHKQDGVALRATLIVDPDGLVRHVSVNDNAVGRNVEEIYRTLKALQTGELTACNWKPGDPVLRPNADAA